MVIQSDRAAGGYNYDSREYGVTVNVAAGADNVEIEPNDITSQATPLASNEEFTGQLSSNADIDFYSINISGSGTIKLDFDRFEWGRILVRDF